MKRIAERNNTDLSQLSLFGCQNSTGSTKHVFGHNSRIHAQIKAWFHTNLVKFTNLLISMIKWWNFIFKTIKVNLTVASHYAKKKKLQTKRFTFIFIVSCQFYAVHEKVSIQLLFPSTLPITKVEYPNIIWWGHMFNSLAQIGWCNRTGQQIYNKGFILVFIGVCVF